MRILRVVAVLCVLSVFALPARSQSNTTDYVNSGNNLIVACQLVVSAQGNPFQAQTRPIAGKEGYCLGMTYGVGVMLVVNHQACMPNGVTTGQNVRVVEKFLQDHPAKLNEPGPILVMEALEKSFPCK